MNATTPTRDWPRYNNSLKGRCSLDIWLTEDVLRNWQFTGRQSQGGMRRYSDICFEFFFTIKALFKLPYRQTQGLLESLFRLCRLSLKVPDYTLVCRRSKTITIWASSPIPERVVSLLVDSTGIKVYGEGEWKARKHGFSKRRKWRKLHIGVDADSQTILSVQVSHNDVHDVEMLDDIIDEVEGQGHKIKDLYGDGAYDALERCRKPLFERGIKQHIPPPENARYHDELVKPYVAERNHAIEEIYHKGRKRWKEESGYHKRSLVEVAMYRYKTIIGNKFYSRNIESQATEAYIGVSILNRMTALGLY